VCTMGQRQGGDDLVGLYGVSYDLGMRCVCQVVQGQGRDGLAQAVISARQIQLSVHRPVMKDSNTYGTSGLVVPA
jgi:hypothetical protein